MTLRRLLPILFLAFLGALPLAAQPLAPAATPAPAPAAPPEAKKDEALINGDVIVAIAEDKVITLEDLRREIYPRLDAIQRISTSQKDFNDRVDALQSEVLTEMINRVLIVKEFQKDGKRHIPASYIDNAVAETLLNQPFNGERTKFLEYLRANGLTLRDYRKKVEEDIIYSFMRNQQRKSESVVSPVKIEAYYAENKQKFFREDLVYLWSIEYARSPDETDAQLIARAQPALARLKAGEKFPTLVREFRTSNADGAKGADLGLQRKADVIPEIAGPLFQLTKGAVSEPIITPKACYLLFAADRKYAGIPPLAEVSGEIEKILAAQMARETEERWIQRLRANAYIRIY